MRTLTLTLILAMVATQAQAVTYQRTATLDDGSSYLYEVTFDISALDDNVVDDAEATSSLTIISGGIFPDSSFSDIALDTELIAFDNGIGQGIDPSFWNINGLEIGTTNVVLDQSDFDATDPILTRGFIQSRDTGLTSAWSFIPDAPTVPEPLTASLLSLAAAPLLLRRRRDA